MGSQIENRAYSELHAALAPAHDEFPQRAGYSV